MTGTIRILLVEDDPAHVELIRRAFAGRAPAHALEVARTLAEAREALQRDAADLVLTDWKLPDGQGVELLRDTGPSGLPLVVMTSHGSEHVAVAALQAGALDYVVKTPDTLADMPRTVERALREWRDRTERERMQEELRRSEERYRTLVEGANSVILRWDTAGRILFMNPFGLRLFGHAAEELVGRALMETIVPPQASDGRDLGAMIEGIIANPESFLQNENENVCRDGRRVWVNWTNKPVFDASGRLLEILSVGNDVTAHRRADQMRRESEERFRQLVEQMPLAMAMSRDLRYVYVNPAFLAMLGHGDAAALLGTSIFDQVAPGDREAFRERALHRSHGLPAEQSYEFLALRRDGVEFPCTATVARISLPDGPAVIGFFRDISGPRRAEEQRQQLEQQLRQSQKIESVGRLAGGVAHDFNNMLSPILGYAEMLRDELAAEDPRRGRVGLILQAAARCRDLVQQLLAFARKQTLEVRPLDLGDVVAGFAPMLRRTLREDVAIETRLAPAPAQGDARQLEQVILNLAINAQDAMPDGGRLLIETAETALDEEYARSHEWVTPGPYALLAVSDTGTGMDQETQGRIFDPFFTTKETGKGTGLGLAMVYGIVKQHGGSITVHSEPGTGTTFRIYLPRAGNAMAAEPAAAAETAPPRGGETVLVVEDEAQVRALAAEVLDAHGYTVLQAGSGAEALAATAAHPGRIDLLLTDVILPDMNGRTLHERLAAGRRLPALFMSGYPADVISHHGVLDEGVDLVRKPFTVRELAARVRARLDAGR